MKKKATKKATVAQVAAQPEEKKVTKTLTRKTPKVAPKEEAKPKAKGKDKVLDDANAVTTAKKITNKKDLKYNYPKEADSIKKRKDFRAKVRRAINSLEKDMARLAKSKLPDDLELYNAKTKELESYQRKVLAQ